MAWERGGERGGERFVEVSGEGATRGGYRYVWTDADRAYYLRAGLKEKVRSSIEAIRVLKALEREGRLPTVEEQSKLARFAGWGAIWPVLYSSEAERAGLGGEHEELRELLTAQEWRAAREASLTAYYTPPEVIGWMWEIVGRLGFRSGSILEPSAGLGLMRAFAPGEAVNSGWVMVEKDPVTGRILRSFTKSGGGWRIMQGRDATATL